MAQMNRFGGDQRGGLNEDMFLWFSAFSTVSAVCYTFRAIYSYTIYGHFKTISTSKYEVYFSLSLILRRAISFPP